MLSRVLQEWFLKRLYRLVLKPFLGKMLETGSLDLNQLDVQFLEGTVELRELVLNARFLSQYLERHGLALTSGHVGHARLEIPYYALSVSPIMVHVDRLVLRVRPCARAAPDNSESDSEAGASGDGGDDGSDAGDAPSDASSDASSDAPEGAKSKGVLRSGLEMIAGGLEDFLHKLQVRCSDVCITLQAEEGGPEASVRLQEAHYRTRFEGVEDPDASIERSDRPTRELSFEGLSLSIAPSEDAYPIPIVAGSWGGDGMGGVVSLRSESGVSGEAPRGRGRGRERTSRNDDNDDVDDNDDEGREWREEEEEEEGEGEGEGEGEEEGAEAEAEAWPLPLASFSSFPC